MNRVRNNNGSFQVLLTPDINDVSSPDSSTLIGSWFEPDLTNFTVIEYPTMNDAMYEALKYPDIDWRKIVADHEYIYKELSTRLQTILSSYPINVQVIPQLMTPCILKNNVFNAAISKNTNITHIINFTIISPWSKVLDKASTAILSNFHDYYQINKMKKDRGITYLLGNTPLGTTYMIKLIPSLLYQYFTTNGNGQGINNATFNNLLKMQEQIDNGVNII
jgi:hypothetical protein